MGKTMHQAACFQALTEENKPIDSAPVLLLIKMPPGTSRLREGGDREYVAVVASPIFQRLLTGEQLTHFQLSNESLMEVRDFKIVGWCPINYNPPQ
jgi:hypothetical protein